MRKPIKFYLTLLSEVPGAFRAAIEVYVFWAGIVFILLSVFAPTIASKVAIDFPLSPKYAAYTFALLLLYGLLRANYLRFQAIESDRDKALARVRDLTKKPTLQVRDIRERQRTKEFSYYLVVYNDGPGAVDNVEVTLRDVVPAPRDPMFRGWFPYHLADSLEHRGFRSINEKQEELYRLVGSWVSSEGHLAVAGLDGVREMGSNAKEWAFFVEKQHVLQIRVSGRDADAWEVAVTITPDESEPGRLKVSLSGR